MKMRLKHAAPGAIWCVMVDAVARTHQHHQAADARQSGCLMQRARFAHAALGFDEHTAARATVFDCLQARGKHGDLGIAADWRHRNVGVALVHRCIALFSLNGSKNSDGCRAAFDQNGRQGFEIKTTVRRRPGRLVAQQAAVPWRFCCLHEACGEVNDVPHDGIFTPPCVADGATKCEPGGNADGAFMASSSKTLTHGDGGAHRALGIVHVAQRRQAQHCDERGALVVDADLIDAALEAIERHL